MIVGVLHEITSREEAGYEFPSDQQLSHSGGGRAGPVGVRGRQGPAGQGRTPGDLLSSWMDARTPWAQHHPHPHPGRYAVHDSRELPLFF